MPCHVTSDPTARISLARGDVPKSLPPPGASLNSHPVRVPWKKPPVLPRSREKKGVNVAGCKIFNRDTRTMHDSNTSPSLTHSLMSSEIRRTKKRRTKKKVSRIKKQHADQRLPSFQKPCVEHHHPCRSVPLGQLRGTLLGISTFIPFFKRDLSSSFLRARAVRR